MIRTIEILSTDITCLQKGAGGRPKCATRRIARPDPIPRYEARDNVCMILVQ
jgi:hypothetical protein